MQIAVDLVTRSLNTFTGSTLSKLTGKQYSRFRVYVKCTKGGAIGQDLGTGATGMVAIKIEGETDYLATAHPWTKIGTGSAAVYVFDLNLNTDEINAKFVDGVPVVTAKLEIAYAYPGVSDRTKSIVFEIEKALITGDTPPPVSGQPAWPLPSEIIAAIEKADAAFDSLDGKINASEKGAPSGVATLNGSGQVTGSQLPQATESASGIVELSTAAEAIAGLATDKAVHPAALAAAIGNAVAGLLTLKGEINASGNPNYPAAEKGDSYFISTAGRVGGGAGIVVSVGDILVAKADNAGGNQAAVGVNWFVLEANIPGLTTVGLSLATLSNPSAIRFVRINADNSVTALAASDMRAALGLPNIVELTDSSTWADIVANGHYSYQGDYLDITANSNKSFTVYNNGFGTVYIHDAAENYSGSVPPRSAALVEVYEDNDPDYYVDISQISQARDITDGYFAIPITVSGNATLNGSANTAPAQAASSNASLMTRTLVDQRAINLTRNLLIEEFQTASGGTNSYGANNWRRCNNYLSAAGVVGITGPIPGGSGRFFLQLEAHNSNSSGCVGIWASNNIRLSFFSRAKILIWVRLNSLTDMKFQAGGSLSVSGNTFGQANTWAFEADSAQTNWRFHANGSYTDLGVPLGTTDIVLQLRSNGSNLFACAGSGVEMNVGAISSVAAAVYPLISLVQTTATQKSVYVFQYNFLGEGLTMLPAFTSTGF